MRISRALAFLPLLLTVAMVLSVWSPPAAAAAVDPVATSAAAPGLYATDPKAAQAAGEHQAKVTNPDGLYGGIPWFGWVLIGAMTLLGAARKVQLPGPIGAVMTIVAEGAYWLLAPYAAKQKDAQQAQQSDGFQTLVGLIQTTDNNKTIADLKAQVLSKAPSQIKDAINALVAELETKGVDHDGTAVVVPAVVVTGPPAPPIV